MRPQLASRAFEVVQLLGLLTTSCGYVVVRSGACWMGTRSRGWAPRRPPVGGLRGTVHPESRSWPPSRPEGTPLMELCRLSVSSASHSLGRRPVGPRAPGYYAYRPSGRLGPIIPHRRPRCKSRAPFPQWCRSHLRGARRSRDRRCPTAPSTLPPRLRPSERRRRPDAGGPVRECLRGMKVAQKRSDGL